MKVLIITPSNYPVGWYTNLDFIPRIGEQIHFKGKGYTVSMVKYFLDADEIKEYTIHKNYVDEPLMSSRYP
jgi:hypothetical protein